MEENVLNNTNEVSVNEVSSTEENYIDALNTLKQMSLSIAAFSIKAIS